jgi:hypothetical protein
MCLGGQELDVDALLGEVSKRKRCLERRHAPARDQDSVRRPDA